MRWSEKKNPAVGTRRTTIGFLWFPVEINGESRWLETVTIQEEWRESGAADVIFRGWVKIAFVSE